MPRGRRETPVSYPTVYWLSVGVLALVAYSPHPLNSDEGLVLNAAWQLWHGKRMYADFLEYVTPGSAYATYLLWWLVGSPSYLAAKLLAIALWLASGAGLALVAARVADRWAAGLAVLLWLGACTYYPPINHNTYSSFAAVWCAWALLRGGETGRPRHYGLAGAAAGLVFLFLQTKGVFVLGAVLVGAWAGRGSLAVHIHRMVAALAGFLASLAPLLLAWQPAVLLHHWFVFPLEARYLEHTRLSVGVLGLEAALVAAMALMAWCLRSPPAGMLAVFQAALFASSTHFIDLKHLAINVFPALVVFAFALHRLLPRWLTRVSGPTWVAAALAIAAPLWLLTPPGKTFFRRSIYYLDVLGHGRGDVFEQPVVRQARHIFAGPFIPGLYFELAKPNPFPVSNMLLCRPDCQAGIRDTLARVRPEVVFLHYGISDRFGYDRDSLADVYIRATYRHCPDVYYPYLLVFVQETCP